MATTKKDLQKELEREREITGYLISKLAEAGSLLVEAAFIDGAHHKQWYIDQIIRTVLPDEESYEGLKALSMELNGHVWDTGIAP